jgi:chromate transporter
MFDHDVESACSRDAWNRALEQPLAGRGETEHQPLRISSGASRGGEPLVGDSNMPGTNGQIPNIRQHHRTQAHEPPDTGKMTHMETDTVDNGDRSGSALEVLRIFLRLGLTSFGGPIAHIGYFHNEFVVRRRWLDEQTFTDLVALCQFLPGPASSQVGFSIGLLRAGYVGALAAWTGFTLPSAIALVLFAFGAHALNPSIAAGLLHGLRLVAVAIVAQAVWSMARTLCPDRERASIAVAAAVVISISTAPILQIATLAAGAIAGMLLCKQTSTTAPGSIATPSGRRTLAVPISPRAGLIALTAFGTLLLGLPILRAASGSTGIALFEAFYRSGALVFGGGHVVLPLLRNAFVTPGWVSDDTFLAGYGAAQAVPGPLFTFSAFLGAVVNTTPRGLGGAALGVIGIFLPGMLILLGTLPYWDRLRQRGSAQATMRGINAAVVGFLIAALYNPVWTSSVGSGPDFAIALVGFALLTVWRAPPLIVVALGAIGGLCSAPGT